MRINKVPVSYRLPGNIIKLIVDISEHLGLSKTELLEELVIKEARRLKIIRENDNRYHFNE